MQIEIHSSFARDAKKLTIEVQENISDAIILMQNSSKLSDIPDVKSLKGGKKAKDAYRMRINDFRICFYFRNNTIELIRVLPRKDVYKLFP